jgi:hypothetical protein
MSDNYLDVRDMPQPGEGKAFVTVNGQNREMCEVSSLKAQIDQSVITRYTLGRKMAQHKRGRAEGTGSGTFYFNSSQMLKEYIAYSKTGRHAPVSVQGYNEDEQSTIGKQEVLLSNVIIKTIPVLILDDNSEDPITFDSDFTFDDVQLLSSFTTPANFI